MNFKQRVISLVMAILSVTVIANDIVLLEHEANLSLISFMARSNDLMQRNPVRSTECFAYYIPLIDQITKWYQVNYEACVQARRDGISEAEAATLEKRNEIICRANNSCDLLSQCSQIDSAEKVFECFVEGGSKNLKTMYDINSDASVHLADLHEEFRLIQRKEYKCTNETKVAYEKESSKAYENFNSCILGNSEVPPPIETPAKPESIETAENSENSESTGIGAPGAHAKLPEQDIYLFRNLNSRLNKPRL